MYIGADTDLMLGVRSPALFVRCRPILCCARNCGAQRGAEHHSGKQCNCENNTNVEQRYQLTRRLAPANRYHVRLTCLINITYLLTYLLRSRVRIRVTKILARARGEVVPVIAVLCYVQLTQTNCWYHGPARPALDCVPSVLLA